MHVTLYNGKHMGRRLFVLFLSPEDTDQVLESPHHLKLKFENGNSVVRFQIADRGDHIEHPVFKLENDPFETYVMYARTGFQTSEEHLKYLVSLGKVPMVFGEAGICVGYVEIKAQTSTVSSSVYEMVEVAFRGLERNNYNFGE